MRHFQALLPGEQLRLVLGGVGLQGVEGLFLLALQLGQLVGILLANLRALKLDVRRDFRTLRVCLRVGGKRFISGFSGHAGDDHFLFSFCHCGKILMVIIGVGYSSS